MAVSFFKSITTSKWLLSGLAGMGLGLMAQIAHALPFGVFDARTMAMGGVGVATGSQFAVFNNPALLSTAEEIHEWFALVPALSQQRSDPDKVEDTLAAFQQASAATPINQTQVQGHLDALDGRVYSTSKTSALSLAIPSRILSGAAFFTIYDASTAKPVIGGDNLAATPPTYTSTLAQRGLRIVENGVAVSKLLEANRPWKRNLALGISTKFLLISGYGYDDPLPSAELDIRRSNSQSGSQFTLDLGLLKEFGIWKVGLVAKNLSTGNYRYGTSADAFRIKPQVRAGFAYQSRYTIFELDIDLLENDPVGFNLPSQIAALGWEWQAWKWLMLRAGYNHNLTGNEAGYSAAGIGMIFDIVQIDIAAFQGDQGEGVAAQLAMQF